MPLGGRAAGGDLTLIGGRILTVDGVDRMAEAIDIVGGTIVAVGTTANILRARRSAGPVLDMGGRTVIPGLIDGHAHMDREGLRDIFPSLAGARSIADIGERIARLAAVTPPGEWIVTMPIGEPPYYAKPEAGLAEGRFPNRHDLDLIAPDHPIYIRGIWGYWDRPPITSIANSLALHRAGIDRDTASPSSTVEIERDPSTGEPTGVFREHASVPVLEFTLFRDIPRFTHEHRLRGLRVAMARYHSAGTTSVYEAHGVAPEVQRAFVDLHEAGELTMRSHLVHSPVWRTVSEAERIMEDWLPHAAGRGAGDAMLRFGGVFLRLGEPGDVTRILLDGLPYTGWAGFVEQEFERNDFLALVRAATRHRIRVNALVFDQALLDDVTEVLDEVDPERPVASLRPVLEHIRTASPAALERMARLNVIATTQPAAYVWKSGGAWVDGGGDPDRLVPHVDLDAAGVRFALSTDNKPFSSLWALSASVERRDRVSGRVLGPGQALTPLRALRALTADAAHLTFEEDIKGSLEPGKYADLAVLGEDLLTVDPGRIRDIEVELTLVGGRVVHGDAGRFAR